jgi:hypothetical protein
MQAYSLHLWNTRQGDVRWTLTTPSDTYWLCTCQGMLHRCFPPPELSKEAITYACSFLVGCLYSHMYHDEAPYACRTVTCGRKCPASVASYYSCKVYRFISLNEAIYFHTGRALQHVTGLLERSVCQPVGQHCNQLWQGAYCGVG